MPKPTPEIISQLQTATEQYLAKYQQEEYITGVTLSINTPELEDPITVCTGHTDTSGLTTRHKSLML